MLHNPVHIYLSSPTRTNVRSSSVTIAAFIVLVAAGSTLFACNHFRRSAGRQRLLLTGTVEAHESVLSFQVSGRIVDLPVDEGKWIEQDAIVARLDDTDYRQREANDEAALKLAQARLALALAGPRPEEIEADRHAMLNLKAQLDQDRADYYRIQTLYQNSTVSQEERDQAETNLKRADAAYNEARQVYLEAREGTRKEDIDVARAAVDQANETLEYARIQLAHTILRAPFAGLVLARKAEPGEVVAPGTPIVKLGELDHVWIRAYVPETELVHLRIDSAVAVRVDGLQDRLYRGRISSISEQAESIAGVETDGTHPAPALGYLIKIEVDNPRHELKPRMPAEVEIDRAPHRHPNL